jgi:hypothetical protein
MFTLEVTPENRILIETVLLLLFTLAAMAIAHPRRQQVQAGRRLHVVSHRQPVAGD